MKIHKYYHCFLVLGLVFFFTVANAQDTSLKSIGDPAPPLSLAKFLKGESTSEFKEGHVYVVEFWATWCKPCIAGMPHLSELAREYEGKVTVIGCSIMERSTTTLEEIENFVAGMGDKMDYVVAVQEGKTMADNWMKAYGGRGIPHAFIVDPQGRVAWSGHPQNLDDILPQVVSGKWDLSAAEASRREKQELSRIESYEAVSLLNPYMGRPGDPEGALKVIDSLISVHPKLKYYPKIGHFTFYSLIKTDPQKALEYGMEWVKSPDFSSYKTITDAVTGRDNLPIELYVFAADAYQAQLDKYPWSMNSPATYKEMAELYYKAGDSQKAAELIDKADSYNSSDTKEN